MSTLKPFDARYIMLAEDRLAGMSMPDVAMKYSMSPSEVVETLDLPEVSKYMQQTISELGYNSKVKRAELIERVIEAKIVEAEESQVWSRKDLAELIKLAQDEAKLVSPAVPKVQITKNEQNNNYVSLMQDLLDVHAT